MAEKRNLCAMVPVELHALIREARDKTGQNLSDYMKDLIAEYFQMKENGGTNMSKAGSRTMAFQIPEELFQRIKRHLERETARTGRRLTQRDFILGLIESALAEDEEDRNSQEARTGAENQNERESPEESDQRQSESSE